MEKTIEQLEQEIIRQQESLKRFDRYTRIPGIVLLVILIILISYALITL